MNIKNPTAARVAALHAIFPELQRRYAALQTLLAKAPGEIEEHELALAIGDVLSALDACRPLPDEEGDQP